MSKKNKIIEWLLLVLPLIIVVYLLSDRFFVVRGAYGDFAEWLGVDRDVVIWPLRNAGLTLMMCWLIMSLLLMILDLPNLRTDPLHAVIILLLCPYFYFKYLCNNGYFKFIFVVIFICSLAFYLIDYFRPFFHIENAFPSEDILCYMPSSIDEPNQNKNPLEVQNLLTDYKNDGVIDEETYKKANEGRK